MTARKHLVYFYRFDIPEPCRDLKWLLTNYSMSNSEQNYKEFKGHGVLFVADGIDGNYLYGRLVKIRVGRVKRINVPQHSEWYELVKSNNGIEQEAHTLISTSDKIMITEYNDDAFRILPQYIFDYFKLTISCVSENMHFAKLVLPESFEKLMNSKYMLTLKLAVAGDLTNVLEGLGFVTGKIIAGGDGELPFSLNVTTKYDHSRKMLVREEVDRLLSLLKHRSVTTREASIETEEGLFKLLYNTLLNDEIFYDNDSEGRDAEASSELRKAFERKYKVAREALEIIEKGELDYWT